MFFKYKGMRASWKLRNIWVPLNHSYPKICILINIMKYRLTNIINIIMSLQITGRELNLRICQINSQISNLGNMYITKSKLSWSQIVTCKVAKLLLLLHAHILVSIHITCSKSNTAFSEWRQFTKYKSGCIRKWAGHVKHEMELCHSNQIQQALAEH